jgi:hypothetical protein
VSPSDESHDVLSVAEVMVRYGMRDRRSARRLMDEAGAFLVAGRLVIRRDDLIVHEEALKDRRRLPPSVPRLNAADRSRVHRSGQPSDRGEALRPGWWRAGDSDSRASA